MNIIPTSFYHSMHPMECIWPDLELMLNIHELTLIYISSESVEDVTEAGILSKQIFYFCLSTDIKPRHNALSQS